MLKLIIAGTAAVVASAHHPVNHDIVKTIKENTSSWVPMEVEENPLAYKSERHVRGLAGTILQDPVEGIKAPVVSNGVPDAFDSRQKWGKSIHPIRD